MSAPSKDLIAADYALIAATRQQIIISLTAEVERLRAERAEVLALLESVPIGGIDTEIIAFVHARRALVAKLRRLEGP